MSEHTRSAETLTWKIILEASLDTNHPIRPGFCEQANVLFWLLSQGLKSAAKSGCSLVDFIVAVPIVIICQNHLKMTTQKITDFIHQLKMATNVWRRRMTKMSRTFLKILPFGCSSSSSLSCSRVPKQATRPYSFTALYWSKKFHVITVANESRKTTGCDHGSS